MRIDSSTSVHAKVDGSNEILERFERARRSAAPPAHEADRTANEPEHATRLAARQIEAYLQRAGLTLEFRVDADTERMIVTVREKSSGEVIRQIPSEEALQLARRLADQSGGILNLTI